MLKVLPIFFRKVGKIYTTTLIALGFFCLVGLLDFTYQYVNRTFMIPGECINAPRFKGVQLENTCLYKNVTAEGIIWRQKFALKSTTGELIAYIHPPMINYPITKDEQGHQIYYARYSSFDFYPLQAEATWRTLSLFVIIAVIVLYPLIALFLKLLYFICRNLSRCLQYKRKI